MRLKLKKGKQKELIKKFKEEKNLSWDGLSKFLGVKVGRIKSYVNETVLIPKDFYDRLDLKKEFSKYIILELEDNWGRIKGGLNSEGNTKTINIPNDSELLAEFYGIMLGDGNSHKTQFYKTRKNKRGTYMIRIVGDSRYDKNYLFNYVKPLIEKLFKIKVHDGKFKKQNAIYIEAHSLKLINFLESKGFKPGNKIKNKLAIPQWINKDNNYLKACLRGLIDTDGSVFRMSRKDPGLIRIGFTSYNPLLLENVRSSFIKLGFYPSKIILNKQFFISRKECISQYLKEIGFSNNKHLSRLNKFRAP